MALQRDAAVLDMVHHDRVGDAIRDLSLNKAAPPLLRRLWRNFILIHFSDSHTITYTKRFQFLGETAGCFIWPRCARTRALLW